MRWTDHSWRELFLRGRVGDRVVMLALRLGVAWEGMAYGWDRFLGFGHGRGIFAIIDFFTLRSANKRPKECLPTSLLTYFNSVGDSCWRVYVWVC